MPTDVDLAEILGRVVNAQLATAERRGLALAYVPPTEPLVVRGDAVRLEQVATNVVSNALKYTPRGGHVRVTLARDGETAVLDVEDDGIGIGPELLPHIFDAFVQAEESRDRARGGMGLGLAACGHSSTFMAAR